MSEWEKFKAYTGIIADAKQEERERIIALLEADCNHAEPQCYHQTAIALIKGENSD